MLSLFTYSLQYQACWSSGSFFFIVDKYIIFPFSHTHLVEIFGENSDSHLPYYWQDLVGLLVSILLLGDFSLVLLTLLQMYSISLLDFVLVLFILPFAIFLPFPAGISALFSHGRRQSAGLARVYGLWNITSLINVVSCFEVILGYFLLFDAWFGK